MGPRMSKDEWEHWYLYPRLEKEKKETIREIEKTLRSQKIGEKEAILKLVGRGFSQDEAEEFINGVKRGLEARSAGKMKKWSEISDELNTHCPERNE